MKIFISRFKEGCTLNIQARWAKAFVSILIDFVEAHSNLFEAKALLLLY